MAAAGRGTAGPADGGKKTSLLRQKAGWHAGRSCAVNRDDGVFSLSPEVFARVSE
jgi:hypothetical protein